MSTTNLRPALSDLLVYLKEIGYEDLYLSPRKAAAPAVVEVVPEVPPAVIAAAPPDGAAAARMAELSALATAASTCTRCRLAEGRHTVVFSSGDPTASLMLVGEGPGAEEDRQGFPFVGPAGELLNKILQAIDLRREDVYVANVVKCRPPGNRDPQPDEVAACRGYLDQQIALVRPKLLVALGKVATQVLLGNEGPIGNLRGRWHAVQGIPTMVTYHPAALLRNPALKRPTWEDMQQVRDRLRELG